MNKFYQIAITILLITAFCNKAFAALTPDQENTLNQINKRLQRENERLFEEEEKAAEKRRLLKKPKKIEIPTTPKTSIGVDSKHCFEVKKIILNGTKTLLKKERKKIIKNYEEKCLSLQDIDQLRLDINNYYIDKGYIMGRAYLKPNQNIQNGILEYEIKEGEIDEIRLNENKFFDKMQLATAFPDMVDYPLNLRDIEQGLEQMNRLDSNNATMKIIPSNKSAGKSILVIENEQSFKSHFSAGYDNYGQKSTGERRRKFTLSQDNLLSLNDNLFLSYTKDQEGMDELKNNENLYSNFSIPFGYWTYDFSVSKSKYLTTTQFTNSIIKSSGETLTYSADLTKMLIRSKVGKTSLNTKVTYKDTKTFFDGELLENSSRKLSNLDIGISHSLRMNRGFLSLGATYSRGIDAFGAKKDEQQLNNDEPKAQFELFQLNGSFYKAFNFLKQNLSYSGSIFAQISHDHLFSSDQISIGDPFSVRGFKNNSVSADSGGYLRNELAIRIPPITDKLYINKMLQNTNIFLGYDIGMVKSKVVSDASLNDKNKAYLSGWATGIKKSGKYFKYDFTYSQGINSPEFVKEENKEIYFSVTLNI